MAAQPQFDFTPKQVAETSIAAYREIAPTLQLREQQVLDMLATCVEPPTGYELFDRLKRAGIVFDLNSVRPRLTSLFDKGRIAKAGKRTCRVTGKTVFTWRLVHEATR